MSDDLSLSEEDADEVEEALSISDAEDASDGSDQNSEEDSDESEDASEDEEHLEPKILPNRTTRASRLSSLLEEQDSADEEFWGQDFFAEEDRDEEFEASESEQEDVPDSDFSESEDEDDEDEEAVEARVRKEERKRKKVLKPPGAAATRRPPAIRPKSIPAAQSGEPLSPGARAALSAVNAAEAAEQLQAPTLRKSTRQRVEEAEKERERVEQTRPKKRPAQAAQRILTQEELLAEAAYTEIENLRSFELLQAAEEEVKKKAAIIRARHSGPYIHFHSKAVNGESLVTCEVANMLLPPEMSRQTAPPSKQRQLCVVTGKPARYCDPLTQQPYADASAFQVIRQHYAAHYGHPKTQPAGPRRNFQPPA